MWVIAVGDPLDEEATCIITRDFVDHSPSLWSTSCLLLLHVLPHLSWIVFGSNYFLTQMIEPQFSKKSPPHFYTK